MSLPALIATSHGTSDAHGAAAISAFVACIAARLPDVEVHEAFVDVQQPEPGDVLARIDRPAVVVPLLLSWGFHVRVDIGGLASEYVAIAEPLGPDARLADVLAARLEEVDGWAGADPADPVLLAMAGSRDPASVAPAEQTAELLAERLGRPVVATYLAAREPNLREARAAHPGAPVATYLLANGWFFDLAHRRAAGALLAEPLLDGSTAPDALVDLAVERYEEAAARLAG